MRKRIDWIIRELWSSIPFIWKYLTPNLKYVLRHKSDAIVLSPYLDETLKVFKKDGITTFDLKSLLEINYQNFLDVNDEIQQWMTSQEYMDLKKSSMSENVYNVHYGYNKTYTTESPFMKLALDPNILQFVNSYMGMRSRLFFISAWSNYKLDTYNKPTGPFMWHKDGEDKKQVKFFILLDNLEKNSCSFYYAKGTHVDGHNKVKYSRKEARKTSGRVTDEMLLRSISQEDIVEIFGPKFTAAVADSYGFHKGGKCTKGTRLLLSFGYVSHFPISTGAVDNHPLFKLKDPENLKSEIQRDAVLWNFDY